MAQVTAKGFLQAAQIGVNLIILDTDVFSLLEFDDSAAAIANNLHRAKLRLGAMDIRIAAIVLAHDALLLSRNLRDFQRVPRLRVEDWTK